MKAPVPCKKSSMGPSSESWEDKNAEKKADNGESDHEDL